MPLTIHKYTNDLPEQIVRQVQCSPLSEQRVLVPGAADVALLRRYIQPITEGLLPSIEPLPRQLEAWLTLALGDDPTRLWLTRQERRFALAWWLREHAKRPHSQTQAQEVEVMDQLLEYGRSEGLDWHKINRKSIANDRNITDFLAWCSEQNWMDASQGYRMAEQAGWDTVAAVVEETHLHVVQHPTSTPAQERMLKALMEHTLDRVHWHLYTMDTATNAPESDAPALMGAPQKPVVRLIQAHDRLEELETVFRCIKAELLEAAEKGQALALSEYVILTPDYAAYASSIPVMEHRFGLPVSIEQGPPLKADPALAKIRTYLYMGVNEFRIDDLVDVFADQALNVPGLSITDASSPNWRTFHALCRRYNLRSLDDFDTQLERVIEREADRERALQSRRLRQAVDKPDRDTDRDTEINTEINNEINTETATEPTSTHGDFYRMMRHHLVALRARFRKEPAPLSAWYTWALEMLEELGTVDDAALTVAIRTMRHQLQQGLVTMRRLALDPVRTIKEVHDAMEALLEGSLAVGKHPGKILFAPLDAVYLVSGKRLFVMGMTDRAYPSPRDPEQLFPGLEGALLDFMRQARSSQNDDGKALISHLIRQSAQCMLSYPQMDGQRRAMISSVLTEPKDDFPEVTWLMELPTLPKGLDVMEHLQLAAAHPGVHPEAEFEVDDRGRHAQLVAAIARFRNDPEQVHLWEGQLTTTLPQWKDTVQQLVEGLWQAQLRNDALPMSVTRFDEYAASPLAYFFTRVLRLSAPEKYSDEAEQNRKGDLLHAIFEQFYRHDVRYGPLVDPRQDPEGARSRIHTIAESLFEERIEDLGYPDTPYPDLLRLQICKVLDKYIDQEQNGFEEFHEDVKSQVRPRSFWNALDLTTEQGQATEQGKTTEQGLATEVPFSFDLDVEGHTVTIQGFIDRIDTDPQDRIRILYDYKTGGTLSLKSFNEQINPGLSFQLPIYVSAQLRDTKRSVLAGYYHVDISKMGRTMALKFLFGNKSLTNNLKNYPKFRGVLSETTLDYFMEQIFEHRIKNIVRAIKEGRFHQSLTTPNTYSDVSRMTRYSKSIAELRHLTLLQAYPQANEAFKHYYVRRPILSSGEETQGAQEETL